MKMQGMDGASSHPGRLWNTKPRGGWKLAALRVLCQGFGIFPRDHVSSVERLQAGA